MTPITISIYPAELNRGVPYGVSKGIKFIAIGYAEDYEKAINKAGREAIKAIKKVGFDKLT